MNHSVKDIHILLNTIHAPSILNSPASLSFIPVCLPKFNPSGYVNAYISFLRKDDGKDSGEQQQSVGPMEQGAGKGIEGDDPGLGNARHEMDTGIALVCISGGGDFDTIRGWCDTAAQVCNLFFAYLFRALNESLQKLESEGILDAITLALRTGQTDYSVSELGIPGLRHFLYKSRAHVQVTLPMFEDPYENIQERRRCALFRVLFLHVVDCRMIRITTLYQILHDAIHAKSGQEGPLKLQYIRTEKESVMGWVCC
jgi:hypothetical protein